MRRRGSCAALQSVKNQKLAVERSAPLPQGDVRKMSVALVHERNSGSTMRVFSGWWILEVQVLMWSGSEPLTEAAVTARRKVGCAVGQEGAGGGASRLENAVF